MNAYSTYETNYYIPKSAGSHQNTSKKRKKYRIKSKFRFITSMIIMIGLCVAGFTALTGLNTSVALTKQTYTQVQVASGDTLWVSRIPIRMKTPILVRQFMKSVRSTIFRHRICPGHGAFHSRGLIIPHIMPRLEQDSKHPSISACQIVR